MKSKKFLLTFVASLLTLPVFSQGLFSTGVPDNLFSIGVRAGVNVSNQNVDKGVFNGWNVNSWGSGFQLGAVVSINMRDFFALQPGFFYESRSGNYAYLSENTATPDSDGADYMQLGHYRNYWFTVPIIAQLRLNLLPGAKWTIDVGPYLSWLLHSKNNRALDEGIPEGPALEYASAERRRYDFGFKFGTGINFLTHFYIGVHYMAGTLDVWKKEELGGRNKTWTVTAGYDF